LEKQIQKLEQEIVQLHKQFETLVYGSSEFAQATAKLQAVQEKLAHVIQQWEKLYTVM
jgi:exonuclease VII small subunit